MRPLNLDGQTFGRLTVINRDSKRGKHSAFLCKCICGKTTVVLGYHLRDGHTKSCGCIREGVGFRKGVRIPFCKYGHALTDDNIMVLGTARKRRCRICRMAYGRKQCAIWRAKNPKRYEAYKFKAILKRYEKYGITLDVYNNLLKAQNNSCAICKKTFVGRPHIDHKHCEAGKVRGLLCRLCNVGIGHFLESEEILLAAIQYLKSNG